MTNPISIAMGMGPECAGISPSKRASSAHVRKIARGGVPYSAGTNHSGDVDLFTWVESFRMVEDQPVQPDTKKIGMLKRFPLGIGEPGHRRGGSGDDCSSRQGTHQEEGSEKGCAPSASVVAGHTTGLP